MQIEGAHPLVLIPAYKPDSHMVALCRELRGAGLPVLIVDDGSGESYRPFFEETKALGCTVERHAVNLGKGRAIKTGINSALNTPENFCGIITADADGQHACRDILRVAEAMGERPGALVTGMRRLTGMEPFKSRAGNTITRYVYRFVTGVRCYDTQTGLRGIPRSALAGMLRLPGERYEYEMNVLLRLRDLRLSLHEIEIETIYINKNKSSHFHPLRDAARIYSVIFRFLLSSILSFCLDYALYLFCLHALGLSPWVCYAAARVVSSLFNFQLNRLAVFGGRGGKLSILRYYVLAATQLAAGAGLVELLHAAFGWGAGWVKVPVDATLFLFSYVLQRDFVFRDSGGRGGGKSGADP